MINIKAFQVAVESAVSAKVYEGLVPEGAPLPAIAWIHEGEIVRRDDRDISGTKRGRVDGWRIYIVARNTSEIMPVYKELYRALDNREVDGFQQIKFESDRMEPKSLNPKYRRMILEVETTSKGEFPLDDNKGVIIPPEGKNWIFNEPITLLNGDRIDFDFTLKSDTETPILLAAAESDVFSRIVDGEVESAGEWHVSLIGDEITSWDDTERHLAAIYNGMVAVKLWLPLTKFPMYNLSVKRGQLAKSLNMTDITIPLDDRTKDIHGGDESMYID